MYYFVHAAGLSVDHHDNTTVSSFEMCRSALSAIHKPY